MVRFHSYHAKEKQKQKNEKQKKKRNLQKKVAKKAKTAGTHREAHISISQITDFHFVSFRFVSFRFASFRFVWQITVSPNDTISSDR